jgi:hypothetical protein
MEQFKSLLPIFALIAVGTGFYYTTNHRLDHLEEIVESLKEDNAKLRKLINKKDRKK